VLGVLPGPAAAAELVELMGSAVAQIRTGVPPIPPTQATLLLITVAFGLTAVVVHAVAVSASAPAAAGVPLLAVFAVPTALADELLPGWMLAAGASGFGLLLSTGWAGSGPERAGRGRGAAGGVALAAVAAALALAVGGMATAVGTAGRIPESGSGSGRGGEIGLSPFTSLRGQLQQSVPTELFRVTGLPRPTYLRALTLSSYVPASGWQPSRPGPGVPVKGGLPGAETPGDRVGVRVENLGFRDYWLPVYGVPLAVEGVDADQWAYDPVSGTAFSTRPRQESAWTQAAVLPAPTVAVLRAADGTAGADPAFLATDGVDPRVAALAAEVTADASSGFDRAVALNRWFTGPASAFRYDLTTAPGNGDDALVEFLTQGRRGYCEQFASAMAVMLRTVGVPARVAIGFTGGRDVDGGRAVSTSDAHAWVEAWFPGVGWTAFDPTPLTDGRAIVPPYVTEAMEQDGDAPAEEQTPAAPTAEPAPVAAVPTAAPSEVPGSEGEAPGTSPAPPPPAAPWLLPTLFGMAAVGLAALMVAAPGAWRAHLRRRRLAAVEAGGPEAADAAWAEVLAESADRGAASPPTDTVRSAAHRLASAHGLDEEGQRALRVVAGVVEESWYGEVHPAPGALAEPVRAALGAIGAGSALTLRNRLLPPSVVQRARREGPRAGTDDAAAVRL
jgi:transglutaminase-like putative cysteine protease